MANQTKSPGESSTLSEEEIEQGRSNLQACLDALDQNGEAGLQAELERIHPPPSGLRRVPLGNLPGSFAQVKPNFQE